MADGLLRAKTLCTGAGPRHPPGPGDSDTKRESKMSETEATQPGPAVPPKGGVVAYLTVDGALRAA